MGDALPSASASQRPTTAGDGSMVPKTRGWRWLDFDHPTAERQSASRGPKHYLESSPEWSAVHDFERRLSRNGIKMSETSNNHASGIAAQPVVQERGGAGSILDGYVRANAQRSNHHVSRSEDFPPLEAPVIASFTNTKKETKVETLERQLRQAQAEAHVWKARSENQEHNLGVSYEETMEWRMKYEDLYSAVLRGMETEPTTEHKKGTTKSLS
ncbi:uncharacterized protein M421DRAFT_167098 [Didymella exigua CBS 183.55]|uniref:Uncharacterized protein n=1 Tax=Didymella exigua CBS 183.55 TaxID=1150837 RepID=A0A6A5RRF2_9PLEO|nr:uncharacterized protein M421DRAFT_167098 [Didymella exigua CBS 183.55]KAF1928067.1 hypothetical protein M421DRAFT_167098 [Didymella exigua CBS 183.55]